MQLYEKFEFFLKKYSQLLSTGAINLEYPDIRGFISLFVTSKLRGMVLSGKLTKEAKSAIYTKINQLRGQYHSMSFEDIESIVNLTFFQCISIYDKKGKVKKELKKHGIDYDSLSDGQKEIYERKYPPVGFEGFLKNYYKYLLRKNLDKENRGLVAGVGWCMPLKEDVELEWVYEENTDVTYDIDDAIGESIVIDHKWVDGSKLEWPFTILDAQERWLLKLRYHDRLYAVEISELIGETPSAIRNKINVIKDKLRKEIAS